MKVFLLLIGLLQMTVGCSDGGVCSSQPQNFAPCNVDHQTCMGPVACRSCNGALGLWHLNRLGRVAAKPTRSTEGRACTGSARSGHLYALPVPTRSRTANAPWPLPTLGVDDRSTVSAYAAAVLGRDYLPAEAILKERDSPGSE